MSDLIRKLRFAFWFIGIWGFVSYAYAHEGRPPEPHDLWTAWVWEPWTVFLLVISAFVYIRGARILWREAGRGLRPWEMSCFAAGWASLVIALVSPVHSMGSALFWMHMVQHEILITVSAPLIVLGRPLVSFLWALPPRWRRSAVSVGKRRLVRSAWSFATAPFAAWSIHALMLWIWHAPGLFQATLDNELVHAAQHLSFFLSGLLFWWALMRGHQGKFGYGASVIYLFTTALHTGILGALLTFSPEVWYPRYTETAPLWGLSALEDQQLGGLIMWIPASLIYLGVALALLSSWLRHPERAALRREEV